MIIHTFLYCIKNKFYSAPNYLDPNYPLTPIIFVNNGCHFNGSAELAFEIQKLQLQFELKDRELIMQQREIENLKEIIALLKKETV